MATSDDGIAPPRTDVVFIGDATSGLGFRLAGVSVDTPDPHHAQSALNRARERAAVVLVTAEVAATISGPALAAAISSPFPLTFIMPGIPSRVPIEDRAARWRRKLGVES